MINQIELRNFRCFDTLVLNGLRRLNILVGESGSGKSAFLESLFLLSCGNPEGYFRLRKWRGFAEGALELSGSRDSFESLFRHLFHNADRTSTARLKMVDSIEGRRTLEIYLGSQESLDIPLAKHENSVRITPITFRWDTRNKVTSVTLEIKDGAIRGLGSAETFPIHFISPKNVSAKQDAQSFSELSRALKTDELQAIVRSTFKEIDDLSLEIIGGETLIHARLKGFKEKIPLAELSGGVNKYVSVALAIATNPNGVVCIDEIENGFYFRDQRHIMKSLLLLCDQYAVQIFASTHSLEFLKAVADVMESRPNDLCILKTSYENNRCTIRKIEGAGSISAIEQDIEIRN
jgi:AAA15 family ATPase/GTPase